MVELQANTTRGMTDAAATTMVAVEQQHPAVNFARAIGALHRMRTTVGLLGQAVVQQEAGTARRRTLALVETTTTRAAKRQRLEDPTDDDDDDSEAAVQTSISDDDEIDEQWIRVMCQTIRMERIAEILRELDDTQQKLIAELEACAEDYLEYDDDE